MSRSSALRGPRWSMNGLCSVSDAPLKWKLSTWTANLGAGNTWAAGKSGKLCHSCSDFRPKSIVLLLVGVYVGQAYPRPR